MASASKEQIHDQKIVYIVTEGRYPVGVYDILDPENK